MIPLCMAKDATRTFSDRLSLANEKLIDQLRLSVKPQLRGLVDIRVYETVLTQTAELNPDFRTFGL
jgi:hypothetical protein